MSTGLSVLFFFFCNICADLRCCVWAFSLAAESGGYFLAAMHGLLIAVASLVAEHRLQAPALAQELLAGFCSCGSWTLE